MKKIFITRHLDADSVFNKTLRLNGFEVIGQSLVKFSPVSFGKLPSADWIFFYSKNAVRFFLAGLNHQTILGYKTAALGAGTANVLAEAGYTPDFIGNGDPSAVAESFLQVAEKQRVLFPRASDSRQSVQRLLGNRVKAEDLVVYENIAKQEFQIPDCQLLAFTSPLNAKAYFSKYRPKGEVVIAIGEATADTLRALQISAEIYIAADPSENALAELALELLGNEAQA